MRDTQKHEIDPLEAIYALNIGDFVAESFISDDLLNKISDRLAGDPAKLRAQLEELIHIYSMDKTLRILGFESSDGFIIYDSIAQTLCEMFQVDGCHIFQGAHKDGGHEVLSLTGTSNTQMPTGKRWNIGIEVGEDDFFSVAYRAPETQLIADTGKLDNWQPMTELGMDKTKSLIVTPLREGKRPLGLLVFESNKATPFNAELKTLANATARMFVTGIRLQQLVAEAQAEVQTGELNTNLLLNLRAQITESIADLGVHQQEFVEALSHAIDARNDFTRGHSKNVAELSLRIGDALKLNEKTIDLVYYAGLLGALGKINIDGNVFAKKQDLTGDERDELRNHPNMGVAMLGKINFLSESRPYVQSQKERWDGSGGPEGLKGRNIPLGSRILAVADAYCAMTGDRPYREPPMSHEKALQALQKEAGTLWDPDVVAVLATMDWESDLTSRW